MADPPSVSPEEPWQGKVSAGPAGGGRGFSVEGAWRPAWAWAWAWAGGEAQGVLRAGAPTRPPAVCPR